MNNFNDNINNNFDNNINNYISKLYHNKDFCQDKNELIEFIYLNLDSLKEDIEIYNKSHSDLNFLSTSNINSHNKKYSELLFEKYQIRFNEISDDINNNNFIDSEFKKIFFDKFLFFDKMLLRPKIEILLKNYEVGKK